MNITFSGEDALKLVKELFPNDANYRLQSSKLFLIETQLFFRCTPEQAFKKFIESEPNYKTTLLMFSTLYVIESEANNKNIELINKIRLAEERKQRFENQLEALETSSKFVDKQTIGSFFKRQISKLDDQIKSLVKTFNINDSQLLQS